MLFSIGKISLDRYLPEIAEASCPDHCPDNVQRAFIEAEKALQGGLFPSAAASYCKAVDWAVTPLVDDKCKDKLLGQKLGNLEGKSLFPEVMLDFIQKVMILHPRRNWPQPVSSSKCYLSIFILYLNSLSLYFT